MSSKHPVFDPERHYSIQIGVVADKSRHDDITEARQLTHDAVIKHAGDLRRTGISWIQFDRDDPALGKLLDTFEETEGPLTDVRAMLDNNSNSTLVVAFAEVNLPIGYDDADVMELGRIAAAGLADDVAGAGS